MEGILEQKSPERELAIGSAKTFDELFIALDKIGSLEGSQARYSAEDLRIIIADVRTGESDITSVTSTGGLRNKVRELLVKESEEKREHIPDIPRVGDRILLEKISLKEGHSSQIEGGKVLEGVLLKEIRLSEPVYFGTGNTSPVRSMRIEDGRILIETQTSTYVLRKN